MAYFDCIVGGSVDGSTLTVTCYSGFAGLTISITNGVDTFSKVCPSTSPYEVVFDGLADGTWTLSTVYNGTTYTQTVVINATTIFYPIPDGATVTPTDDIQTWLYCAGIFDKNYTSIAQVLADASTLQALIASNNAADYMARSTSWASSVTANVNAMSYIGANDYCADALLNVSTWLNAIVNSSYMENVLNVKVPTMTGNTTPSGTVIYDAQISSTTYAAYRVFDNNLSTYWSATNTTAAGHYVGYRFPQNVKVNACKVKVGDGTSTNYVKGFKIQENVNGTWQDILGNTAITPSNGFKLFPITNNSYSNEYRLMTTSIQTYDYVAELQFYGRAQH